MKRQSGLSFAFALSWRAIEDVSKTLFVFLLFPVCRLCILSSFSLSPGPYWGGRGTSCSAIHPPHIKDRGTLPFLPQPLYGGLMIYCSGFSLFSSYLEGGQFNKHAHFLSRPSDSPHSQRNVPWCHCVQHSCDPVQRLFHQNSLSREPRDPARKPNPTGTAHMARCSRTSVLLLCMTLCQVYHMLMLTSGRHNNANTSWKKTLK